MSKFKRLVLKTGAVIFTMSCSAAVFADSVLPTGFATDTGDIKADIVTVGGAFLGLTLAIAGFIWVRKAVR